MLLSLLSLMFNAIVPSVSDEMPTHFEQSNGQSSADYETGMTFYQQLALKSDRISIRNMGNTDSDKPLHLVMYSHDGINDPNKAHDRGDLVIMINNAIHPGEPDGVDASMLILRQLAFESSPREGLFLAVIPYYNIGGALNRSATTRANQNGPAVHGFRGNSANYDLNRDFMKADSLNARSFAKLFNFIDPDVFLDTHVSNGADYQHTMTLISTQPDKMGEPAGSFMRDELDPLLYRAMARAGQPMTPYVNVYSRPPDEGFSQFLDLPRYSTGYTSLFGSLSYMTETHMLKPFHERVAATELFITVLIEKTLAKRIKIKEIRDKHKNNISKAQHLNVSWALDDSRSTPIEFRGYAAEFSTSEVTGLPQLRYNRDKAWERHIPWFNHYISNLTLQKPKSYLIPQGYWRVIDRLWENGITVTRLTEAQSFDAEVYRIDKVDSRDRPYEGHFFHTEVSVTPSRQQVRGQPGDWLVTLGSYKDNYIMNLLEPQAPDSLFRWNYFDTVLQQKEHFSSYVFEPEARAILEQDTELKAEYEQRKASDPDFAGNAYAQLDFIYKRSRYAESAYMRYPVVRIME